MPSFARVRTGFSSPKALFDRIAELRDGHRGKMDIFLQAFDPLAIVSERHLLLAYENARRAFEEGGNVAGRMETEVLVRAAGTHRINEAIARAGVKDCANVLILFDGVGKAELLKKLNASELKPAFVEMDARRTGEIAKRFGIGEKMLAVYTIEQCVLEKVAMADVAD